MAAQLGNQHKIHDGGAAKPDSGRWALSDQIADAAPVTFSAGGKPPPASVTIAATLTT